METVDVVIGTFGDREIWDLLARRAVASARNQTHAANRIIRGHENTLAEARNKAAAASNADWLIFLDADDELDLQYIEKMLEGTGDIRQPSTLGVVDGREDDYPVLIPPQPNFMVGNHLVIGTMVRRELFFDAGGFRDLPVLEDWDLWVRAALAGGKIGTCPEAIYRVHVRVGSRNTDLELHGRVYSEIQNTYQAAWSARFRGDESSLYEV